MNIAIATFVGFLLATGAVVGGVHVAQGDQHRLVGQETDQLYQYSTK